MTDDTTTLTADGDDAPTDAGASDATAVVAAPDADAVEPAPGPAHWYERSTGGQTYLDRYVLPALTPLVSVALIIFYVTNISRVLLSGKGTIALVVASIITAAILIGASVLSASTRMRTQSLAVFTSVALLIVTFAGWIAVGHAQEKTEATVAACTPVKAKVAVSALLTIKFDKSSFTANTGCVEIDYGGAGGHTLTFDPPGPTAPVLTSDSSGEQKFSWDFTPGTYTLYCTVPGHRAAGMQATLVIK